MLEKILKLQNWARLAGFVTIFLSVIVCSFLYAISYPPLPSGEPMAQHSNANANAKDRPAIQDQGGSDNVFSPVEEHSGANKNTSVRRDERERLEKAANERGLTLGTLSLVVVTVFLVLATAGLGIATFIAAVAAKEAAQHIPRVERAYVFLWKELKRKQTPNASGVLPGDILEVQFAFKNYGKTPAIIKRIDVEIRVVASYPDEIRELALDMPPGLIISADETTVFLPIRRLILPEQWTAIRQMPRTSLLLFLGVVKYEDIFGSSHETGFCLEWDSIGGDGFGPSPSEKLNHFT